MKWTREAEQAAGRVPFFVRKRVKNQVAAFSAQKGKSMVDLSDVAEVKEGFLSGQKMADSMKGYDISVCFGGEGCPNAAHSGSHIAGDMEKVFEEADLLSFLKERVSGKLRYHHEFRCAVSDCPNACSRPQIADVGIIGARRPAVCDETCTGCMACIEACREDAVSFDEKAERVTISHDRCVMCGRCIAACPAGTITEDARGFRVLLGGRLGRRPRLAMEMKGLYTEGDVLDIVQKCLRFYKETSENGERFAHILTSVDQILNFQGPCG